MPRIAISLRNMDPYPTIVAAMHRITGNRIADIAAALSYGDPVFDEELFKQPLADQFGKVRNLLNLIRVAAVPMEISADGQPMEEITLLDLMSATELATARGTLDPAEGVPTS
jgi:hypothetical protein